MQQSQLLETKRRSLSLNVMAVINTYQSGYGWLQHLLTSLHVGLYSQCVLFFFVFFLQFALSLFVMKISSLYCFAAFFIGTESKMKLWDVLATCLLLLSSVATRPLYQNTQPAKRTYLPSSYSDSVPLSVEDEERAFQREDHNLQEISMENQCKAHSMFSQSLISHLNGRAIGPHRGQIYRSVLFVQTYINTTCNLPIHMWRERWNPTCFCLCFDQPPWAGSSEELLAASRRFCLRLHFKLGAI